jgi:arsenite/tail-anchored protein-transporting ATPase
MADSAHDAAAVPLQTRFAFFTGKGGVGKTSIACASAVALADGGHRVLLVSTDPASNLDEVFGVPGGLLPVPVPGAPTLHVMNLDPEAAALAYRDRVVGPYRGVLPDAVVRGMEEQLSGACTVEIAAFDQFTALLAGDALADDYDHVIFDTAPTGHTLRLLSLPAAWTGFIATNSTGTSCLGPLAGLEGQRERYSRAMEALADPDRATVVLVTRAEPSAVREAARTAGELWALGIRRQQLVINGVLSDPGQDAVALQYAARQQAALETMPRALAALPARRVPLAAWDLTGLDAIRAFAAGAPPVSHQVGHMAPSDGADAGALPGVDQLVARLARQPHGIVMSMGKGGVGKTSLAVAIALGLARAGVRVHLTTTDPAAHVDSVLAEWSGGELPLSLTVGRIDPGAETERYSQEVLAAAGDLDDHERALLTEDLRSPCTEEIAVFRAFARVVAQASDAVVVLDTAPTGHTLLLLDAAESYHREVSRTAGQHIPDEVRTLLPRLRDPGYTRVLLVTLAESTPVHEAERLQDDLRRAGIEPLGWVINASLASSGTAHPLLGARARLERPRIAEVTGRLAGQCWLVPWR